MVSEDTSSQFQTFWCIPISVDNDYNVSRLFTLQIATLTKQTHPVFPLYIFLPKPDMQFICLANVKLHHSKIIDQKNYNKHSTWHELQQNEQNQVKSEP